MICFELGWKQSHQSYDPGFSLLLLNDSGGGAGGESWLHKSFFSILYSMFSVCYGITVAIRESRKIYPECSWHGANLPHSALFPYVIWTCLILQRLFIMEAWTAAAYMMHSGAWVCCSWCGCIPLCQGNISGNPEGNFSQLIRAELITRGSMVPQTHSHSLRRSPVHGVPQPVHRLS